jgi:iron complex transport system ATP-binding protein
MINPNPILLEARKVTVKVGKKPLISGVDCSLARGRVAVLVGPNGAGKSTLLRTLTGETEPSDGSVLLEGQTLKSYGNADLARRRACLPQSSNLTFPFTIREVVAIGRYPYRDTRARREPIIDAALHEVGLLERSHEAYPHLSGGEKQRVHLARVLAQLEDPTGSVLLLDEPTASLDLTFQQLVFRIAGDWAARGAAVLLVLHDLNQAMRYAHSVTLLHEGCCVASGPPAEVLTSQRIEQVYGVRARWIQADSHSLLAVDGPLSSN